jgi:hypothetical protein
MKESNLESENIKIDTLLKNILDRIKLRQKVKKIL